MLRNESIVQLGFNLYERQITECGNTEIEKKQKNNPFQDGCLDFLFEF